MSHIRPVLIGILLAYSLHCHYLLIMFVHCDVAVNCGSDLNLTALDGRNWVGESLSAYMSGKSRTSTADHASLRRIDPVPYQTSRISATEFRYAFHLSPGQKIIRLHFFPASYRGFEKSVDYFSVKAGPFTLLRDYSASLAADSLGVKYIVKEFCLNLKENQRMKITFSPSQNSKSNNKVYAFVNGIEIISMRNGLYYTPQHAEGARIVGLSNRFYTIDNDTALEVMQRFNVGGSSINSLEDLGMFRLWNEDSNYLLEPRAVRVNHLALKIPPKIFQTSWKSGKTMATNQTYYFGWKVPVDLGFGYLVRLHFCDHNSVVADSEREEFSVLINNQIADAKADVIRWSGGTGIPVYRDYVILLKGDTESSKSDLLIGLEATDELVFQLLKGLEIFKLSDVRNNLAAPNPVFPEQTSASSNLKTKILDFWMGMTVVLLLLSLVMYKVKKSWEENFRDGNFAEPASAEPSCYRFSLADIKLATQNFSDGSIIGRGGFGNVYKGLIPGVAQAVAIKRLNPKSNQGAREFSTEIETLSKLRHINLVSLIGYCNECQEMILVYEYIPRGTIADNLYKNSRNGKDCSPLTWDQRLSICIGAARGLEYLHTGSEYGVIHRDVKDTNILLDESFVAKISDFGLSELEKITHSKSYVSTNVKGTAGYWDPDYVMAHRLTRKSDVYSFGVVMLVILSGRPAVDNRIFPGESQSLESCFRECMAGAGGDFSRLVDPCLRGEISSDEIRQFVKIVEKCLQWKPKKRPTMTQVVADLEQVLGQLGCPMLFGSADTIVIGQSCELFQLQLEAPIVEENVTSPHKEGITSRPTHTNVSPTRGRGKDNSAPDPVRKPFLGGWPWKIVLRNKDPCRASTFSRDFESASESDSVWERFLPSDIQEILSKSVGSPLDYATKKELFFNLCQSPIIINDGKLSFWLSKSSGKKCFMMCARQLSIEWVDDPAYWSWKSIPESRFSEVAELEKVCWLEIQGKMQAEKLSLKTTYAAYLVYRVTEDSYGLEVAQASVGFARQGWHRRPRRPVKLYGGRFPQHRTDGWREIFLGEFFNDEGEGEIEMKLWETKTLEWKRGLIVEGIELRPKEDNA